MPLKVHPISAAMGSGCIQMQGARVLVLFLKGTE